MKDCVGQHIDRARVFTCESSLTVKEVLCCVENGLHDILSPHSAAADSPLDVIEQLRPVK